MYQRRKSILLKDDIKRSINDLPENNHLYLVNVLSEISGFFANNRKLLFLIENIEKLKFESIETEYLLLQTNINIRAVENSKTFKDGFYNIIVFKGEIEDDNISPFINLCTSYSMNVPELRFKDFFYSMISLFQLPADQQFKNALGFYGELKFMQYIWNEYNSDLSVYWHKSGSYSKNDFVLDEINFEIKTLLSSENVVKIKHSQIYGNKKCYLVIVTCEESDNGDTIIDLIKWFNEQPLAFKSLNFCINIQRELKRISSVDASTRYFRIKDLKVFNTLNLDTFESIPGRITNVSYDYDFIDEPSIDKKELYKIIFS